MPSTYRTAIPLPDAYREFIQAITGVAEIHAIHDDEIIVDFVSDKDDQYALAELVRDLQEEINGIGFTDPITVPRPKRIEESK